MGRKREAIRKWLRPVLDRAAPPPADGTPLPDAAFEDILDEALSQLSQGQGLEATLARYPEHAPQLRPLLATALAVQETPSPQPDEDARQAGLKRLLQAAMARRQAWEAAFEDALTDVADPQAEPLELPEVLDHALTLLDAGVEPEVVLQRYAAHADILRPILKAALAVRHTPPPEPSEEAYFAGRERLLRAVARRRREMVVESPGTRRSAFNLHTLLGTLMGMPSGLRRAAVTVALLLIMIVAGFSVTQVAASALPNSPLYPVKRFREQVQLLLTPSPEGKAWLYLKFGQERLREAEALAHQRGEVDPAILAAMLAENDRFFEAVRGADPERQAELLIEGARVFRHQRRVLSRLREKLRSEAQREFLRDVEGQAGEDQAIAEEVQRDLELVELIPTPAPPRIRPTRELPTATPLPPTPTPPPPTQAPTPTRIPPTPTPIPPTATPQLGVVQEPVQPPTASPTVTATRTPTPTSTQNAPTPPPGGAASPTPLPATNTPVPTPTPLLDIGVPTPIPGQTPGP